MTNPHRIPTLPDYIKTTYVNTGLLTKSYMVYSPDQLRNVTIWEWPDQQAHDNYHADPVIQHYEQHKTDFYAANSNLRVVFDQVTSTDEPVYVNEILFTDYGNGS